MVSVCIRKFKNIKIVSIDLKEIEKIENIYKLKVTLQMKYSKKKLLIILVSKIDVVLSDMAVNTTGNKNVNSLVTGELSIEALNFSTNTLKKQGSFCLKNIYGFIF